MTMLASIPASLAERLAQIDARMWREAREMCAEAIRDHMRPTIRKIAVDVIERSAAEARERAIAAALPRMRRPTVARTVADLNARLAAR